MNDSVLSSGYSTPPRTSISPCTRVCPSAKLLTNAELEECFASMKKVPASRPRRQQWIDLPVQASTDRQVPLKSNRIPSVHQWKKVVEPSWMERERHYPQFQLEHALFHSAVKNSEEKHSFTISESILREKFQQLIRKTT